MKCRLNSIACFAGIVGALAIPGSAVAQSRNSAIADSVKEANSNLAAAESLVSRKEADLGRPLNAAYRARMVEGLASRTQAELEALASAGAGADLRDGVTPNALGAAGTDLVYTPVVPCRIFDTRTGGGQIAANASRNFVVSGVTGFAAQGGNPAGCGIPTGPATAVMVNFAVISPAAAGDIRAFAVANPQPAAPLASVLNYGVVPGLVALANGLAVPICDPSATSCAAGEMRIQVDVGATDVLADVVGYFRKADLPAAMPMGSDSIAATVLVSGNQFLYGATVVSLPLAGQCHVTCQVDVEQATATGTIFFHTARRDVVAATDASDSGWGNDVPTTADSTSATKSDVWTMAAGKTYRFGCAASASGAFVGKTAYPTATWICR